MRLTSWLRDFHFRLLGLRGPSPRRRLRRFGRGDLSACFTPVIAASVQVLESRTLLSAVVWTGASGDLAWNNAANWSTDSVPNAAPPSTGDDVAIGDLGGATITVSGTGVAIGSLHTSGTSDVIDVSGTSFSFSGNSDINSSLQGDGGSTINFGGTWSDSGPVTLTGGNLNFSGTGLFTSTITSDSASAVEFYGAITTVNLTGGARVGLSGGTLYDGTLTLDPGQTLHVDSFGTLSNVTLTGNLDLSNNHSLNVTNGLTLNGTAYLGDVGGYTLGQIVFYGTQTIGGTGDIVFGGHIYNTLSMATSASTVTIGPNLTVHGAYGYLNPHYSDSRFVNQGTIASDAGGQIHVGSAQNGVDVDAGSLVNSGTLAASHNGLLYVHTDSWSGSGGVSAASGGNVTLIHAGSGSNLSSITADGGAVYLDGGWTSSGPIVSSGGGLVSLYNGTNSGSMTATSGGTVNFGGTWSNSGPITLTGGNLNFSGTGLFTSTITSDSASAVEFYGAITTVNVMGGARVGLSGGTLYDGTLTLDPGQTLHVDSFGTLSNVTLTGNLDLSNNHYLNVTNGLTLNGTAYLGDVGGYNWGQIVFYGTQTIGGTGDIVFGGHIYNTLSMATSASTVTIGPNLTVHGAYGYLNPHYSDSRFVNQGTIASDAGGQIHVGSAQNGVDVDAGSLVNSGTLAASHNGLLIVHTDSWSGTGAVSAASGGNVTLVHDGSGSNLSSITADGGAVYLDGGWTSSGPIVSSGGGVVSLYNGTNSGSMTATSGGTVNFGGTWSNSGPITLTGGNLNFFGTGTFTSTITSDSASAVEFYGAITTVNLTGGARVGLSGGTLYDSTLTLDPGQTLHPGQTLDPGQTLHVDSFGTLSNVTLDGNLDVANNHYLNVTNGLTLNGTAYLGDVGGYNWGQIVFYGTQTIGGTGDIVFGGHIYNTLSMATSASTVTIGPNLTVHGAYGYLNPHYSDSRFVNQGTIASDAGGQIHVGSAQNGVDVDAGSLVNSGTLAASHNGLLYVHTDSWSGSGGVSAASGGNVTLIHAGSGSNLSSITADGGAVYLDGGWTSSGPIVSSGGGLVSLYNGTNSGSMTATSGGTVNFGGTWSNSGPITLTGGNLNFSGTGLFTSTITSDSASAVEFYGAITTVNVMGGARVGLSGGTLYDGTLTLDPGQTLHVDSFGTLSNVTLTGNLDLSNNHYLNVTNGLTLNGTAYLGDVGGYNWGQIVFYGTQTIGGTGDIVFGGHIYNTLSMATSASTVTIGPNLTVHGAYGYLNPHYSDSRFVNQGTIASDAGGQIHVGSAQNGVDVDAGSLVNSGTLAASHNGLLIVHTDSWSGTGAVSAASGGNVTLVHDGSGSNLSSITADGGAVYLDGGWTSSGPIVSSGGGVVSLYNGTNSGSITVTSGGTVNFGGTWSNSGNVTASANGRVNLYSSGTWGDSGGTTVTIDSNSPTALVVANNITLKLAGNLMIAGAMVTLNSSTVNGPGKLIIAAGTTLDLVNSTINADVDNLGTIISEGTDALNGAFANQAGALLELLGHYGGLGESTLSTGHGFTNHGEIELTSDTSDTGASLTVLHHGTLFNAPDGLIEAGSPYQQTHWSINAQEIDNQGIIRVQQGRLTIQGSGGHSTLRNTGTITVNSDDTIVLTVSSFDNSHGHLIGNGTISSLSIDGTGYFATNIDSITNLTGNLTGTTTNNDQFAPLGALHFSSSGTAGSPQHWEALSADLGNVAAGFAKNFAYGTVVVDAHTYVKMQDAADNSTGSEPEAVYVDQLVVAAGGTLDLSGLNLYARSMQIDGTISSGSVTLVPDGGPLTFGVPAAGQISASGEIDDWTFAGLAGDTTGILFNPGTGNAPSPLGPQLGWAQVQIIDPDGHVIASADNASGSLGSQLMLSGVSLATDGTYHVKVFAPASQSGATGNYVLTASYSKLPPVITSLTPPSAVEGTSTGNIALATFIPGNGTPDISIFTATINWGDGNTSTATSPNGGIVATDGGASFTVLGSHIYNQPGAGLNFSVTVVDDTGVGQSASTPIDVADAALTDTTPAATYAVIAGKSPGDQVLATFTDDNPWEPGTDLSVSVDWGGPLLGTATVSLEFVFQSASNSTWQVVGHAAYDVPGTFAVVVSINDVGGSKLQTSQTSFTVTAIPVTIISLTPPAGAVEGFDTGTSTLAVFRVLNPAAALGDFTATIEWGDGSPTTDASGDITANADGTFNVLGGHTYSDEATGLDFRVTVVDDVDRFSDSSDATMNVADAPLTILTLTPPAHAVEGIPTGTVLLATFSDANPHPDINDYTIIIDWGDGTTSTATAADETITANSDGTFNIFGGHTFDEEATGLTFGSLTAGGTPVKFDVADAPLTITTLTPPPAPLAGISTGTVTVATFSDAKPTPDIYDFSATIAWGDGQTTTATALNGGIIAVGASFSVVGSHTYNDAGTGLTFSIEIDDDGASTQSASTTIDVASAATQLAILTSPAVGTAGTTLTPDVNVAVEDKFGNIVTSDSSTVTLTLDGGTFASGGMMITAQAIKGVATFSSLVINTAGSYSVSATDGTLTGATSGSFTISAAAASQLVILQAPSVGIKGVALAPEMQVAVEDKFGNILTTDTSAVTISIATGPGGASFAKTSTLTVNAIEGVATFKNLILGTIGSYTLGAKDGSLNGTTTGSINISGPASKLVITQAPPATGTAGVTLKPAVTVTVEDKFGNVVGSDSSIVTLKLNTGKFSNGTSSATAQAVNGVATFDSLKINKVGTYVLNASDGVLTKATSGNVAISPASASQLQITTVPASAAAGATIGAVEVTVQDAFGNTVPTDTSSVTLAIATGPTSTFAGGTLTEAAGNVNAGVATFSDLVLTTAGKYTFSVTDGSLTQVTNPIPPSITINPAAASQLQITSAPSKVATTAGQKLSSAVQVTVQDAFGNTVKSDTSNVTIAIASGPAGTFSSGTLTVAAGNGKAGIATFSDLVLNTAGTYTFSVTDANFTQTPVERTPSITINPAAAAQLAYLQSPPSTGTAGVALSPEITVAVEDKFGNIILTNNSSTVTAKLISGSNSKAAATAVASGGVATFSKLIINTAGSYTLAMILGTLTQATSGNIVVSPAAASQLQITAVPASAIAGATIGDVSVTVQDAFGNTVTTDTSNLTIAIASGPSGTFTSGTLTAAAGNVNPGVATFSDLVLQTAGTYTFSVSDGSLTQVTVPTPPSITINPAAASQLVFTTFPSTGTHGVALGTIQVTIEDAYGNTVKSDVSSVTISVMTGPGTFTKGTLTVNAVKGVAKFLGLVLNNKGTYTLQAVSGNGYTPAISGNLVLS